MTILVKEMKNSNHQSDRAKARWSILRDALLKNKTATNSSSSNLRDKNAANDGSVNKHSIHKFPGFQMLQRSIVQDTLHPENKDEYEIVEYEVPIGMSEYIRGHDEGGNNSSKLETSRGDGSCSSILVRTKERKLNETRLSLEELTSHAHFGVDNTGNTRVWDCSNVLAFLVMGEKMLPINASANGGKDEGDKIYSKNLPFIGLRDILSLATHQSGANINERKMLRVLELGSGMAALPSLALSMLDKPRQGRIEIENMCPHDLPYIDVTITDGHPKAIQNNIVCAKLMQQLHVLVESSNDHEENSTNICAKNNIRCRELLWKANKVGANECAELMKNSDGGHSTQSPFDLVLVSDCTHFTDFHADLAVTIGRVLRIGGVCILCQPRRGTSLDLFIELIHAMNGDGRGIIGCRQSEENEENINDPLFQVDLHREYSQEISARHQSLLDEKNELYEPNIHYPLLLILKKLREYSEETDTDRATCREHVKNR